MTSVVTYRKQLGDLVLLQPTLAHIGAQFGGPVRLNAHPGFEPLLSLMGVEPISLLRPARADRFFAFEAKETAALRASLTLAKHKLLGLTRSEQVRPMHRRIFDEIRISTNVDRYRALVLWELAGGNEADFRPPRLDPPPPSWRPDLPGLPPPSGYLLLHPSAAWQEKAWSGSHWARVLKDWQRRNDLPVVITGGTQPWELALCAKIADTLGNRAIALAGKTELTGYLHLVANAALVACIDGSASHLAAAFDRPALTLFGPTNPVHWHWPGERSRCLWAADYSNERKPPLDALPEEAVCQALDELTGIPK